MEVVGKTSLCRNVIQIIQERFTDAEKREFNIFLGFVFCLFVYFYFAFVFDRGGRCVSGVLGKD